MHAQTLPQTAALTLLYAATLLLTTDDPLTLVYGTSLAIPLIWLSVIDFQTYTIPDVLNLWVGVLGFAVLLLTQHPIIPSAIAAILVYLFIRAVAEAYRRLRGRDGLGMGDAKLLAAGAFWVGPMGLPSVIFLGAVSGIVVVLALRVLTKRPTDQLLAFGPFLAYALYWVWLSGPLL